MISQEPSQALLMDLAFIRGVAPKLLPTAPDPAFRPRDPRTRGGRSSSPAEPTSIKAGAFVLEVASLTHREPGAPRYRSLLRLPG